MSQILGKIGVNPGVKFWNFDQLRYFEIELWLIWYFGTAMKEKGTLAVHWGEPN